LYFVSSYFQDELNFLRETGKDYARLNPKLAKYLAESSTDPDVERLMEGFAFLTARLRAKIDDELPELTHSLIQLLWPTFLRPFPPVALLKFTPVDKAITERHVIGAGAEVFSKPVDGQGCTFRTIDDCVIYPFEISNVHLERTRDRTTLELDFSTLSGLPLRDVKLDDLRISFCGDSSVAQMLFLWSMRYLRSLTLRGKSGQRAINVPLANISPGGLGAGESLLPQSSSAIEGYRLLQEFFFCQEKFHCIDLRNLAPLARGVEDSEFTLVFEYSRPLSAEIKVRPDNVQLYCYPIVNLLPCDAEPQLVSHDRTSYRVRPLTVDNQSLEIFSIDAVVGWRAEPERVERGVERCYPAFESFEHDAEPGDHRERAYYRQRVLPTLDGHRWEHDVSFVLHDGKAAVPSEETISIHLTCFNGRAPAELAVGDICIGTQTSPSFVTFRNITRPSAPIYPPLDGGLNWSLISNLSLNYMSLLDRRAFTAIIGVYDYFAMSNRQAERAANKRAEGIVDLQTKPVDRLFRGLPIRGLKTRMRMRESCYQTEGEMYLFAGALAEFLSLYASANSFHELEVIGEEKGEIYAWPPKIGRQPLI
jgi:type VI secretion system protein ImpG